MSQQTHVRHTREVRRLLGKGAVETLNTQGEALIGFQQDLLNLQQQLRVTREALADLAARVDALTVAETRREEAATEKARQEATSSQQKVSQQKSSRPLTWIWTDWLNG